MAEILDNPLGFESEAFIPEEAYEAFARAEITASILLSAENDGSKRRPCTLMLSIEPPADIPYKTLNPPPSSALCELEEIAGAIQELTAEQKALFGKAWLQAWTEEQERKQKNKGRKRKASTPAPRNTPKEDPEEVRGVEEQARSEEEERQAQPEIEQEETEGQAEAGDDEPGDGEVSPESGTNDEELAADADDISAPTVESANDQPSLLGGIEL